MSLRPGPLRVRRLALRLLGWLGCCVAAAAIGGCAGTPAAGVGGRISTFVQGKGAPALQAGVQQYERGQYPEAARSLRSSLDLGLNLGADRARAHKYLAFMHCVSDRPAQCRSEFERALEALPEMELDPAEAGHPLWGPVFRSVKARR